MGPTPDDQVNEPIALEVTEIQKPIEVSLNSIAGLTSPKTMKLRGSITAQPVVALIDPGATHNFIASLLVSQLNLPVTDTEPYGVRMGIADNESGRGICQGIALQLQELEMASNSRYYANQLEEPNHGI